MTGDIGAIRRDCTPLCFSPWSRPVDKFFTTIANRTATFIGKPIAFVFALASILIWASTGSLFGYSDTWQLVVNTSTTIITFLIVFLIQNSQNRDAAAIQAKLDEVIRSLESARNEFIGIEHLTDNQLELIRRELEHESVAKDSELKAAHEAVSRLISRN
jgi:low affinity Fe/Cu permease